ncbi:hypothetical protein AB5J55_41000 [Streptomyces sp. R11]|uniref:Uncharacterized protein n=1 Tax=Streptomyces sp. R11 TaxID=3238625 RepID=A0AB39NDK3_9ACTN
MTMSGADLLSVGSLLVGVGPGLITAAGDDDAIVVDCTGLTIAPAALVRSKCPDLTAGQVINRLIKSAATFAHHKGLKAPGEEYGYGIVRPYSALTMDIPAGPQKNPLGKLTLAVPAPPGASIADAPVQTSSRNLLVLVGGVAAVVVVGAIVFALLRSRRNGGPGAGSGGDAQYPMYPPAQQFYPNTNPYQGQPPQHPNPYTHQPPHQGQ